MFITRIILAFSIASIGIFCNAARHTASPPIYSGKIQLDNSGIGAPPASACDSTEEKGYFYQDDQNLRLYICFDSGWRRIDTSPL